jgi:hypothetical protein
VVLIGDAAASNDPSFGAGLSLALGDVRALRDRLLSEGSWDAAGHDYAAEHDRRYDAVRRVTGWIRTLFLDPGPEAAAIRIRALPRIVAEPSRRIDYVGLGPGLQVMRTRGAASSVRTRDHSTSLACSKQAARPAGKLYRAARLRMDVPLLQNTTFAILGAIQ